MTASTDDSAAARPSSGGAVLFRVRYRYSGPSFASSAAGILGGRVSP